MTGRTAAEEILRTLEAVVDYLYTQDRCRAMRGGGDRYGKAQMSPLTERAAQARDLALGLVRTMTAAEIDVNNDPFNVAR